MIDLESRENFQNFVMGFEEKLDCDDKNMIYLPPSNVLIPESLNWYERGYVTEIRNQGTCGACWAFCGIAALEGQYKRMTGKLVKLSEQQLIDCSTLTGNNRCDGGQMCRAYEYAAAIGGVALDTDYPLTNKNGKCQFTKDQIVSNVTGYLQIPYANERALLMAVALVGPVAAGLNGQHPTFRNYKGGFYNDPECSNRTLNHAVTIIGYGTENGKDYWLIKNSWGSSWGENGFGKIARNKNNLCGIASKAMFPVLSKDEDGKPLLDGPIAYL